MKTLLPGVSFAFLLSGHAIAAVELYPDELEAVTAGGATAIASATALGNNVTTVTFAQASSGVATISALELLEGARPSTFSLPDMFPALPTPW